MARRKFTQRVIDLIRAIPEGRVATYGGVARLAGSPRAARQVARVLHSCSRKENLPWHRVVGGRGRIMLRDPLAHERQRRLLLREGVDVDMEGRMDLDRFLWKPDRMDYVGDME